MIHRQAHVKGFQGADNGGAWEEEQQRSTNHRTVDNPNAFLDITVELNSYH